MRISPKTMTLLVLAVLLALSPLLFPSNFYYRVGALIFREHHRGDGDRHPDRLCGTDQPRPCRFRGDRCLCLRAAPVHLGLHPGLAVFLGVEGLRFRYGWIEVLHGIDLEVEAGEIVTVVGANGAGKTTLLRCLSGVQPVTGGSVTFRGQGLSGVPAWKRPALGLTQSPEGRQIFTNLSVEENLRLGAYHFKDAQVSRDMKDAFAMFPILREKRNLAAGGLSGGQQQMLAMARALMGRPACLLLDEPSMGLAPIIVAQIFEVISALKIADRGYVMETGRIAISGPADRLISDPRIREAYLGI